MFKPFSWLLIGCLGASVAACGRPSARAAHDEAPAASDATSPAMATPPPRVRLTIELIAAEAQGAEPRNDPANAPSAQPAPAGDADQPGFRLTVPICRRAERMNDPLARTAECAQMLQAARDQAEACRKAFENGDDKSALSPACRQAAGFR